MVKRDPRPRGNIECHERTFLVRRRIANPRGQGRSGTCDRITEGLPLFQEQLESSAPTIWPRKDAQDERLVESTLENMDGRSSSSGSWCRNGTSS